jgi:hypothetical protein
MTTSEKKKLKHLVKELTTFTKKMNNKYWKKFIAEAADASSPYVVSGTLYSKIEDLREWLSIYE